MWTKATIEDLLFGTPDELLFREADRVRQEVCGDEVHLRGILEFSNHCRKNCLYCGLRRDNRSLPRYRMLPEEIVALAAKAAGDGMRTIILQSGEDLWFTKDRVVAIIRGIKERAVCAITLSLGERGERELREWKEAGADRYLLKHETANPRLFSSLCPEATLEERLGCLRLLKSLGYQAGSGILAGLPGQRPEDYVEDLLLLQSLDVDMAGIGPFIPHPETPLGHERGGDARDALRLIAVARIVLREVHIPATTALGTVEREGREKGLRVGANVVMACLTPLRYREKYQVYPNRICVLESSERCPECLKQRITNLGRKVSQDFGHSLKGERHAA